MSLERVPKVVNKTIGIQPFNIILDFLILMRGQPPM